MPDRKDLSFREKCNKKERKTDRNMTCKFRSSAIHSFGTVSTHRAVLLSDQGQSSLAGYCSESVKLFTWKSTFTIKRVEVVKFFFCMKRLAHW
jgi:hypothetical protein